MPPSLLLLFLKRGGEKGLGPNLICHYYTHMVGACQKWGSGSPPYDISTTGYYCGARSRVRARAWASLRWYSPGIGLGLGLGHGQRGIVQG